MENDDVRPRAFVLKVGDKLVFEEGASGLALPGELPGFLTPCGEVFRVELHGKVYVGHLVGARKAAACGVAETSGASAGIAGGVAAAEKACVASGYRCMGLKAAYTGLDACDYKAAGKLMELLHWNSLSRFCGRCGGQMSRSTEISKKCPCCGNEVFAPVSPAIIVLVRRGREALLVHARNFSKPVYGLVAGFVETGESLEECVRREVMEETSLQVTNIRYVGSQPWPYPNSLMLGFTAEYAGGELCFADGELTSGGFFGADNLPQLPPPPSIARALIDAWLKCL